MVQVVVLAPHCDSRQACKCKMNILTDILHTYCLPPTLLLRKSCTLYHSSIICLRSLQTHQFDPTSQCQDKPRNKLKGFNHCFSLVKRVCSYKRETQECSTLRLPQLSGKYEVQPSKCSQTWHRKWENWCYRPHTEYLLCKSKHLIDQKAEIRVYNIHNMHVESRILSLHTQQVFTFNSALAITS